MSGVTTKDIYYDRVHVSFFSGCPETFFLHVLGIWDSETAIKNFHAVCCLSNVIKFFHQPSGHSFGAICLKFGKLLYLCDA